MMLVDSHCHLDFPDFAGEHAALIARAAAMGVSKILTICTTLEKFKVVHRLTQYGPIYMALGVHPHEAAAHGLRDPKALVDLAGSPKVVGIGETGFDFFYDKSPRLRQEESFRVHCDACRQTGLPLIVHTREAEAETVRILHSEMAQGLFTGEIHCFTGSAYLRDACLEMGLYISASGITTFKKSEELRAVFKGVPLDRLLVETDAPYLAPTPYRGKRNEPAYTHYTAKAMAQLFEISLEEMAAQTTANFHRLFSKVPQ